MAIGRITVRFILESMVLPILVGPYLWVFVELVSSAILIRFNSKPTKLNLPDGKHVNDTREHG